MKQISKRTKKLFRSRRDKMIAGVCGGLAIYFNMDPTWVRLIFILCLMLGGSAILVYVIMWLIVPKEPIEVIK
jgi:phage shock protein C